MSAKTRVCVRMDIAPTWTVLLNVNATTVTYCLQRRTLALVRNVNQSFNLYERKNWTTLMQISTNVRKTREYVWTGDAKIHQARIIACVNRVSRHRGTTRFALTWTNVRPTVCAITENASTWRVPSNAFAILDIVSGRTKAIVSVRFKWICHHVWRYEWWFSGHNFFIGTQVRYDILVSNDSYISSLND